MASSCWEVRTQSGSLSSGTPGVELRVGPVEVLGAALASWLQDPVTHSATDDQQAS